MQNIDRDFLIEARLVLLGAMHILETEGQEIVELLQPHKQAAVTYSSIRLAVIHSLSCIEDALQKQKP